MLRYRINLTPDEDTLLVTCPDLPEVTTFGEDGIDARMRASDAILTALQGRIAARQAIPEPTEGPGDWVVLGGLAEAKVRLYRAMRQADVSKAELARRLQWHGPSIDRLLDLDHDSRFGQIEIAFQALGRTVSVVDEAA